MDNAPGRSPREPHDEQRSFWSSLEGVGFDLRTLAGVFAVVLFIVAGFQAVNSPEKLTRAIGWFSFGTAALSALITLPRS